MSWRDDLTALGYRVWTEGGVVAVNGFGVAISFPDDSDAAAAVASLLDPNAHAERRFQHDHPDAHAARRWLEGAGYTVALKDDGAPLVSVTPPADLAAIVPATTDVAPDALVQLAAADPIAPSTTPPPGGTIAL